MGITLLKITNAGIRVTDTITIPVIKAVVDVNGSVSAAQMNAIYNEIYSRAAGMVSIVSAWSSKNNTPDFSVMPRNATYGGNVGFKFNVVTYGNRDGTWNVQFWFNNTKIGRIWTYTGYADYECCHFVLFVNENNNVLKCEGDNGLYVKCSQNPGYSIQDNKYVTAPVLSGQSLLYWRTPSVPGSAIGNIDAYITGEIDPDDTDPYNPGGDSGTGGGTGDFDGTGDDINFPSLPTLSAVETGFITLFNPSIGELSSLSNYMWSNPLFDIEAWKKIFANPMDAILGLSIVPVAVPNGGAAEVTVGNIPTGVSMNKAAAQYVEVDCGTLNVNEFWGAYLDYDPYTKAELYLPYIGTHPLAVDDIMNKSVHVKYHVDILSGACCAYVKCGGSVIYTFVGQCSCSIPITGNDWTNVINGALSIAASIGTMVATGGATAPMAVSAIASSAVNSLKPTVEKSGSMGGAGGMLGVQTPYLILTRPRQAVPNNQNKFSGYPSFITADLGDLTGYTEIESIHLNGIPGTEQELSEIESLLKGGVIL